MFWKAIYEGRRKKKKGGRGKHHTHTVRAQKKKKKKRKGNRLWSFLSLFVNTGGEKTAAAKETQLIWPMILFYSRYFETVSVIFSREHSFVHTHTNTQTHRHTVTVFSTAVQVFVQCV